MAAVTDRLPIWRVYRDCLRAWRRDFWRLGALAAIVLLPLLIVQFALYGAADISLTTDDAVTLWIVSIPVFVYSVESHHFLSALIERLEGAERHGHPAPHLGALLRDLPWARLRDRRLLQAEISGPGFPLRPGGEHDLASVRRCHENFSSVSRRRTRLSKARRRTVAAGK